MQEGWYVAKVIRHRVTGDRPRPVPLPGLGHHGHDLLYRRGR